MAKIRQSRIKNGELERLRARLAESEETMKAIRSGDVDAIVVDGPVAGRIFTLQSPDEPYRILAERMNEGAATLTTEGTILFCNQRLAEMVRVPAERLLGSSLISLLREEERPGFPQLVRQALRNNVRTEGWLLRNGGTMLPVQLSLSAIPLEESGQGICLVATDLSDQKRVEEAARQSESLIALFSRAFRRWFSPRTETRAISPAMKILPSCWASAAKSLPARPITSFLVPRARINIAPMTRE